MSRYDFDPYGQSQQYVAKWELEMQRAELRRQARASRVSDHTTSQPGTSLHDRWMHFRTVASTLRRQLLLGA